MPYSKYKKVQNNDISSEINGDLISDLLQTKPPLVSIIIIVKNAASTIKNAIESVINQTYPNIELIIIDGASNDGTLEIIENFRDQISKFISEPDESPTHARNKGLRLCSGEYIYFNHSDDTIPQFFIQKCVFFALRNNADFVYGNTEFIFNDKDDTNPFITHYGSSNYKNTIKRQNPFPGSSLLIHKICLDEIGLYDERFRFCDDYEFSSRLALSNLHGVYCPDLVVKCSMGGRSMQTDLILKEKILQENIIIRLLSGASPIKVFIIYLILKLRMILVYCLNKLLPKVLYEFIRRTNRIFSKRV